MEGGSKVVRNEKHKLIIWTILYLLHTDRNNCRVSNSTRNDSLGNKRQW